MLLSNFIKIEGMLSGTTHIFVALMQVCNGIDSSVVGGNSLLDMDAKCGWIAEVT